MVTISSKPVKDYVKATNTFDTNAAMSTFKDDAVVNDIQREFVGKSAIKAWTDKEVTSVKVTVEPVTAKRHYDGEIVTFKIAGDFDKKGLPDPLLLTYYFTLHDDQISQLIILRNKTAQWKNRVAA